MNISVSLLQGLLELVQEIENTDMLSGLYLKCFPNWLKLYCQKLDLCKKNKQKCGDDEHFDAIICLLSVSLDENKPNVELCQDA